jgi:hypothetical protein
MAAIRLKVKLNEEQDERRRRRAEEDGMNGQILNAELN